MSILTNIATKLFEEHSLDSKLHNKIARKLLADWNIPLSITNDLLTLRRSARSESDYVLYHIICELDDSVLPEGYPSANLADTFNQRYINETIEMPLKIKAIQITEDQWIGRTTARELFRLGNSKYLNYNVKTQRATKKIVTLYGRRDQINLNAHALSRLDKLFDENRFIPNTITLNIPDIDENVKYYDEETDTLIISQLKEFDLTDGYHRYVSMQRKCALDDKFDTPMELRITCFSETKARQFIWQEDQKTKMSKIDSESFNRYNTANIIVKRLQDDILYGNLISDDEKIIRSAELANSITIIYGIKQYLDYKPSDITKISKEILNGFAEFEESNPKIFDSEFTMKEIFVLISLIKCGVFDYKIYKMVCDKVVFPNTRYNIVNFRKVKALLEGGNE